MALSPVTRESDFKSSIKKYFLDTIETTSGVKVFFEELEEIPKNTAGTQYQKWVIISFGVKNFGTVSECQISINMYTLSDPEGDDLADLFDTVIGYIIDESKPSGLVTIPYYNTSGDPWVLVGGIMPFIQPALGRMEGVEGVQFQAINILCKWGGK